MKIEDFPEDIRHEVIPRPSGRMIYRCLGCAEEFGIERLLYTCPSCGGVLLLHNPDFYRIKETDGLKWRKILDHRRMLNVQALKGVFRYYEFIAPVIPLDRVLYLGECHTPVVRGNPRLRSRIGRDFYFKNDGLNPSASFKDRGMACALSFLNHFMHEQGVDHVLSVCASTGDTSASAALYASYLGDMVSSIVLLPQGKVTPQQLGQPLGSGARVLEIPGVFDDCMKVVETLADGYHVALLNSKNSWRILGQETFSFEIAQDFDYEVGDKVVVVPIGNAGNITAVLGGFMKFYEAGVIKELPKVIGVQSEHADPVFRYYLEEDAAARSFVPVNVRPSVAQAAMIGNPVSMPRVIERVRLYEEAAGRRRVFMVQVGEQEIMDAMLTANRNGNIACTQGGGSMAGFVKAIDQGFVEEWEVGVLDSTAHMLKFLGFQEMYFEDAFDPAFEITPKAEFKNTPLLVRPRHLKRFPEPGRPLEGEELALFVRETAVEIARMLGLEKRIQPL